MGEKFNYRVLSLHIVYWLYELVIIYCYSSDWLTPGWFYIFYILVFYFHYYILVPKLITAPTFKSIALWFLVFLIITILRKQVSYYLIWEYLVPLDLAELKEPYDFYASLESALFGITRNSAGILGVALGSRYIYNNDRSKQLERQKLNNELKALKNQIDIPETINILSKLEHKSQLKPASIQEEIIQLSNVLRYHLYSNENEVVLSKELAIVQHQLDLYNELNSSAIELVNVLDDRIIKTGLLSKAVGEVLKHTKQVESKLSLHGIQENTFLKISDENETVLNEIRDRIINMFGDQLNIQTSDQAIIIQLN